jgi:hypothetical protein
VSLSDGESLAVIYAAIVSTAALALEVRRWVESGCRLSLDIMAEAKVFGAILPDENTYLAATVRNRGLVTTTITNYGLHEYRSILHRLFRKSNRSAIVAQVLNGQPLPHVLQPGTRWMGSASYNDDLRTWAETGRLFVAIYHSHASRPIQRRVVLTPKQAPAEAGPIGQGEAD